MKLLISGATGFIGRHLSERLIKDGHDVFAIARPTTDLKLLTEKKIKYFIFSRNISRLIIFVKKERFDGVIHLASLFLTHHKSSEIKGLIDSNILLGTFLLEASAQSHVSWFINTGTSWQHYQNQDYSPVNLYAASKQAFEDIARYYVETSSVNFVTIELSDTFGPSDNRPKIFNLWSKMSHTGEEMDMSPGGQIIDMTYIDDVVEGYVCLIALLAKDQKRKFTGKTFGISSDERLTLKQLAARFEQVTGTTLRIHWGKREYRSREVMNPWNKGRAIPGWRAKITLTEGIKRFFEE